MRVIGNKVLEKVINIMLDVLIFLFGIILLVAVYNNIQVKLLGNDYSNFFGYSIFEVKTGSMSGTIEIGDWIVVKKSNDIKSNDIITYEQDGKLVKQRVLEAYNGKIVTKEDNNSSKDEKPVSKDQIIGEVVNILPGFGIIHKILFNPWVLLASIITLYLIAYTFKKDNNENKNNELVKGLDKMIKKILDTINNFINKKKEVNEVLENTKLEEVKIEEPKEEIVSINEVTNPIETEEDTAISENELDKTMYFRMVSVAEDDLKKVYSKKAIARLEEEEEIVVPKKEEVEEVEEENEDEIQLNLEILQKKKKKCKTIIEKAMLIKTEELNKIIDILNNNEKYKPNEATIKEEFLKVYIDAKYYNFCGDTNVEYNGRNMNTRIENALKDFANKLVKSYKGSDAKYSEKVHKYLNFFTLIMYMEQAYIVLDDIQSKRDAYTNKVLKVINDLDAKTLKDMINEILKVQKLHYGMLKYSLNKLNTTMFELEFNNLVLKHFYGVELKHNIEFSKVYSDYIVDKTYSEGVVAEDKMEVLVNILLVQITKDMLNADFKRKYVMYVPGSLYGKANKLDKVFKLFSDEYAKNSIYVVVRYQDLVGNKKVIKDLVKQGYNFALDITEVEAIKAKDLGCINLMQYIFIDKKVAKKSNVLDTLPKDLHDKLVYENIESKVGNFWG